MNITLAQTQYSGNFVYGDARNDAPELAHRGPYRVGVRTVRVVNPNQLDILNYSEEHPNPRYDRPLTLEVWYPGVVPSGHEELTFYEDVLGSGPDNPERPNIPFEFPGRALRDAQPDGNAAPYPLVIVSHGYPGSRYLMTYLTENLASKGYVVVSIDHTESTHGDKTEFRSTLLNRPLDVLFVLNKITEFSHSVEQHFLSGLVEPEKTGLIGYSMGGYGVLNVAGAGFSQKDLDPPWGVPGRKLDIRRAGNAQYISSLVSRVKAVVALAPWGAHHDLWTQEGLKGLHIPALLIVGDHDDVSGYENGVKKLFTWAVNSERYLLVYQNARHNIAPNPAPPVAKTNFKDYMHYTEPVWDSMRMNNINQHFITAFLGTYLQYSDYTDYLNVVPLAAEGKWLQNENGTFRDDHTYWKGFQKRTALGLELHHKFPE